MAATDHDVAWTQLFGALDRAGLALHLQIRRAIVVAIERRVLTPEARLPSSRQLAGLLGVARNTVVAAYQQLIDEGFLVSHERSGIFLAPGTEARRKALRARSPLSTGRGDSPSGRRCCRRSRNPVTGWTIPTRSCSVSSTLPCSRPTTGARACARPPAPRRSTAGPATSSTRTMPTSWSSCGFRCCRAGASSRGPTR
ncbi:GntR family transcriptional regulator [Methylobacterium oryzae CBMB20]